MLRAVSLLSFALFGVADEARLAQVSLAGVDDWNALRAVMPRREQLESLTNDEAVVWATTEEVKALLALGLTATTEGVVDWTDINRAKAQQISANYTRVSGEEPDWTQYCDYDCLSTLMVELQDKCFIGGDIGVTNDGRRMWLAEFDSQKANAPEVFLAGNIHGDETVGGQVLIHLLWDLCAGGEVAAKWEPVLENINLFVLPMYNADGYMRSRRGNANNADLNRNYPNQWSDPDDSPVGRQTEVQAMMAFTLSHNFALSLMYHGGALVTNYAYDSRQQGTSGYSATSRDAEIIEVSSLYADTHPTMHRSSQFPGGIVNGAMWYVIYGSHQDFMYDYRGECLDLTLEVSNVKWPAGGQLPGFYADNEPSLLAISQWVVSK